jgi:UDP-N-acetylmuramyl pentapeptide phosphotransferase/UDP-N-acetylglucosamine-1-phosphate transferase
MRIANRESRIMRRTFPVSTIRDLPFAICALLLAAMASSAITALAIRYAHKRNLLDQPGRRRSHTQPTPRGGGIGIVATALAIYAVEAFTLPREALPDLLACIVAIVLVAAVGWVDDHRGLAARWRFAAHALAGMIVLAPHVAAAEWRVDILALAAVAWFAIVWSINLHNFMDGIDGLLGWQSLFVFVVLGAFAAFAGAQADALHLFALAAAVAGFVPFNFPQARVFMGDVGSGALGLLIAIGALRAAAIEGVDPWSGLIAVSAFVVDATCSLLSRMLRGRRWYSAHREHLYQWLVRSGRSHARVVGWYMAWNLVVVVPVLCWLQFGGREPDAPRGAFAAAAVHAAGIVIWIYGKRWSLHNVKAQSRHAAA